MNKHTPGPWRLGKNRDDVVADQPSGHDDPDAVDYYGGHLVAESIGPQNRDLIAAAPDLLEALQELRDLMQGVIDGEYEPDSVTLQIADAAMAKARGQ